MSKTETLSIDLLRLDGDTQARVKISEDTVEDYAELIAASNGEWPFGPLDVFHDGSDYFLADGFHRTLAALRLMRASIPCHVRRGTAMDAKIFGMTANDKHGLRMSPADKRACVEWLLDNGGKRTQVEIAKTAGVSVITVKRVVAERKPEKVSLIPLLSKTLDKSKQNDSQPPVRESLRFTDDLDVDGDPVWLTPVEDEDDTPEPELVTPEKPQVTQADQGKLNRQLAQSLIDKAVRAVDDLNFVKPDHAKREAAVKLLQGVKLW